MVLYPIDDHILLRGAFTVYSIILKEKFRCRKAVVLFNKYTIVANYVINWDGDVMTIKVVKEKIGSMDHYIFST